jgi:(1->4)-alpha-D-glucan 1-alpha-D-glucosylmutase
VADIYQGDELVSLSLVDPDNRRPVDWDARREALAAVKAGNAPNTPDIRKLTLIVAALDLRKRKPEAFSGSYEPIEAGDRAIAYLRGGEVLVAAEILPGGADAVIEPPKGAWHLAHARTHRPLELRGRTRLADLLDEQGIALLERA